MKTDKHTPAITWITMIAVLVIFKTIYIASSRKEQR